MRSIRDTQILNIVKMGSVIAVVLFTFFALPVMTQAQSSCPTGTSQASGTCRCEQTLIGRGEGQRTVLECRATTSTGEATGQPDRTVTSVLGAGGVTSQTSQVDNGDGTVTQKTTEGDAAGGNILSCVTNPGMCFVEALKYSMGALVGGLAYVVLAIASFILWIVGGLFNWVVIKTVFQFGSTFGTSAGMLIAWGILRDIGNIVLLFSFIFMGLATILNTHALDEYSARKALPRLIIFAVLLNFSLFAAQIVIDVSNSMAAVFTAQAGDLGCSNAAADNIDAGEEVAGEDACANDGIAGQVIQMAGVSSVWSGTDIGEFMKNPAKHAPVFIGLAIFVTVTAVVLLAAAIMLIFRAVMLCLLMVLSPIGFAGMAIPPLQEFAQSWWKQLLKNAFFAPIYLLLVLISLKIVEGLIGPNNNGSFAKAMIEGSANAPQIFVVFAVVIAFMVASLMVANRMGAAGASFATKSAGGAVLGAYGFLGRRTVGRAAAGAANKIYSSSWGQRNGRVLGLPGTSARSVAGILKSTSEASLSPRGLASTLGKGAHLDFGKPNKTTAHGFHGIEEKATKEREEYFKKLKPTSEQKGVATETQEELDAIKEKLKARSADKLAEVEAQRLKVQEARLKNDENLLAQERKLLDQKIKEFDAVNTDDEGKDLIKRQDELNKRLKAWNTRAEQAKTDTYTEEGLHGNWYPPGSVGGHADHEARDNIRKNAGKSKIERALKDIQEAAEKGEGDSAPAPAAPAAGAAPAADGDAHAPH
jgi:hypothetical protein